MNLLLSPINFPGASGTQKGLLNKPIRKVEVMQAIKDLQNNNAPGQDGLTTEFYKAFHNLLTDPLLKMLSYSFKSGALPTTMMDANISLILKKKNKPADDCASYKPIALLDVDLKLLAKILAGRLECTLPDIISLDQTGFILGCNSYNKVRRLLNLIQHGTQSQVRSLVISLDVEACDRIEWPYLLHVLSKLNLGDHFIERIWLLYSTPRASVITIGMRSPAFTVRWGARRGCPFSPLCLLSPWSPWHRPLGLIH